MRLGTRKNKNLSFSPTLISQLDAFFLHLRVQQPVACFPFTVRGLEKQKNALQNVSKVFVKV